MARSVMRPVNWRLETAVCKTPPELQLYPASTWTCPLTSIFAAAAVGNFVTMSIKEETTRLAIQYERAQEAKDKKNAEEVAALFN